MTDRIELANQLREHANQSARLAAVHRVLGVSDSAWIASDHEAKAANLIAAADLIERETVVPMTEAEILDAFCETPGIHQFIEAFRAGVRFAERRVKEANKC